MSNSQSQYKKISTLNDIDGLSYDEIEKIAKQSGEIFDKKKNPHNEFKIRLKEQIADTDIDLDEVIKRLAARAISEKKHMEEDFKKEDIDYLLESDDEEDVTEHLQIEERRTFNVKNEVTNTNIFEFTFDKHVSAADTRSRRIHVEYYLEEMNIPDLYVD